MGHPAPHIRPSAPRRPPGGHHRSRRSTVMSTPTTTSRTTTYEVRLAGHLDEHWATWLDDLALVRHDDGTTVLTGPVSDQSQLHGLLARVRDLGAPLLSLRALDSPASAAETTAEAPSVLRHPVRTER